MIDGSMHPFEENIARTKQVGRGSARRRVCRSRASSARSAPPTSDTQYGNAEIIYTDPDDAVRFVQETGVDSLAVAIGTCHGIYPSWMKPELKLDLLQQLKARMTVPLVLHGGSNNPDKEIGESVKLGINKINISSDIKVTYHQAMRTVLQDEGLREPLLIQPPAVAAMKVTAAEKIDLFDAADKARLY